MAVEASPLFTFIPDKSGIPAEEEMFLLSSIMLSSTDKVVVFIIVSFPSTVKFPCILVLPLVTVISAMPSTVVITDAAAAVTLVEPDMINVARSI